MEEGSPMIAPGQSLLYTFTPKPTGTRWYHSHVMDNHSGDEHPVHTHRYTLEITKVGDKLTSGVMKDTISMPRFSTAEIDFRDGGGPSRL
jgi:FtsP/CotA-like multicopper oxidase with cupredoxin domain